MNVQLIKHIILLSSVAAIMASCNGKSTKTANTGEQETISFPTPKSYTYRVVREYPHSTDSYTQGLLWHDSILYESSGGHGNSRLMKTDLETGKLIAKTELDRRYFGEGIAALNDRIYMLTWEEGRAFVFDAQTLAQIAAYDYKGEGWGLTTDGQKLYMSDGSDKIFVRDPETFNIDRTINVTQQGRPVGLINELEWIDGRIWANIYTYSEIVIIDPATGFIEGIIDFSGIKKREDNLITDDVFNGIAFKQDENRIFVTGKQWNKLYEVEIIEK